MELLLCPECDSEQYPSAYRATTRQSPGHFSVRFRDHTIEHVYIDGVEHDYVEECMCGDDGWAVCQPYMGTKKADYYPLICERCMLNLRRLLRRGSVSVSSTIRTQP